MTHSTITPAQSEALASAGFTFEQPQRNRVREVLRRLGEAAIRSQKITDHEAASAAQSECLRAIEALVSDALKPEVPTGWTWEEVGDRLRNCSIHSIAGGEPERYLIKIGCPDIQTMQAVRDGMVGLREAATPVGPAAKSAPTGPLTRLAEIPPTGSEERERWLATARQHGFKSAGSYDGMMWETWDDTILALMSAARRQGQCDVLEAGGSDHTTASTPRGGDETLGASSETTGLSPIGHAPAGHEPAAFDPSRGPAAPGVVWSAWSETDADSDPSDPGVTYCTEWFIGRWPIGADEPDCRILIGTSRSAEIIARRIAEKLTSILNTDRLHSLTTASPLRTLRPMSEAPTGVPIIAKHKPNAAMPHGWIATIKLGHGDDEAAGCYDTILHYNGEESFQGFRGMWTGWLPMEALAGEARRAETEGLGSRASDGGAGTPNLSPDPITAARAVLDGLSSDMTPEEHIAHAQQMADQYDPNGFYGFTRTAFLKRASVIQDALSTVQSHQEKTGEVSRG